MLSLNLKYRKGEVPVLIFDRFVIVFIGSYFCHPVFVYVSVCMCVHVCVVDVYVYTHYQTHKRTHTQGHTKS